MRDIGSRQSNGGARLVALLLMLVSLGFVAYLYPLPDQNIERVLSSMSPAERLVVSEMIESSYWSSWLTNLLLLFLGVSSGALWLARAGKGWRAWAAIAAAFLFVIICSAILLTQAGDIGVINSKLAFLKQLSSAHAWSFLTAEIHRLLAIVIAAAAAISMGVRLTKRNIA